MPWDVQDTTFKSLKAIYGTKCGSTGHVYIHSHARTHAHTHLRIYSTHIHTHTHRNKNTTLPTYTHVHKIIHVNVHVFCTTKHTTLATKYTNGETGVARV